MLTSSNNSPGERDITSLRQISTQPTSQQGRLLCFHSANERSAGGNHPNAKEIFGRTKTKKPTLLGGGCVEICLNEVMSPSPGERKKLSLNVKTDDVTSGRSDVDPPETVQGGSGANGLMYR